MYSSLALFPSLLGKKKGAGRLSLPRTAPSEIYILLGYSFGSGLVAIKAFISMKMQANTIRTGTATQNARVE